MSVESALKLQQGGQTEEAARIYQEILAEQPKNADALHFLGLIAHGAGFLEEAVRLIASSLQVFPDNIGALNNLGNVLKDQGRFDKAIELYEGALAIDPTHPQVHSNLGAAYQSLGRYNEAAACYRRALGYDPHSFATHTNLGVLLQAQGDYAGAVESYRRAVTLKGTSDRLFTNLGGALIELGKYDEALQVLDKALQINPSSDDALANRGAALKEMGRLGEAIDFLSRALKLNPRSHIALTNLGDVWKAQGRLAEAVVCFQQSLAIEPADDAALNNLGSTLIELGRPGEAVGLFRKSLALHPARAATWSNLLFTLNYLPHEDPGLLFVEHLRFGQIFGAPLARLAEPHCNIADSARPLRVGFVSGDLRDHPVASFIEPVFATHDRNAFEFFAYSNHPVEDAVTARLQKHLSQWRNVVGLSDDELAAAIRRDRIDILVDLSGHTARNRLLAFARKPAPIQVTMIGYMQTTGLAAMDYRITDAALDPVGVSERWNVEELVRLPAGAAAFTPPAGAPPVNALPAHTNGFFTFGSFNNLAKVTPRVIEAWASILQSVPNARLIIVGRSGSSVHGDLQSLGVAAGRVEMINRLPTAEYLALHHRVDLLLDTFPYNGGTTTLIAAWMGVPFVTLAGDSSAGRAGAGLLNAVGLSHFVACDEASYIAAATNAACELDSLAAWRSEARSRLAPHFNDGSVFTRQLEAAFRRMWEKWCASRKSESLAA